MKSSRSLIAITVATTLALIPSAIAAPKTTSKAAGRVTTTVVNTILSGSGVPSKTLGINGDFYIDTKNLNLYGPKTKGIWKVATSLKQTDTKSVTTVIGETGSTGEKGDKGDKGATGSTGATGSAGVAGVAGAKGSDAMDQPVLLDQQVQPVQVVDKEFKELKVILEMLVQRVQQVFLSRSS